MAHPALARAVSASLQLLAANATNESLSRAVSASSASMSNASAAWRHHTLEEAQRRITLYINAGIIAFWIVLLIFIWRKYKKTTSAVVVLWLAWFGVKAFTTHQAVVGDVQTLATHALAKTREACIAVYHMVLSWGKLVAPALGDLVTLLTPAAIATWAFTVRCWNMSNGTQKGYFLMALCVIAGVIFSVITMYRQMLRAAEKAKKLRKRAGVHVMSCKDIMWFALFQASFLVVGPVVWWVTQDLPGILPGATAILAMSVYPCGMSLVVMKRLQREKEALLGARKERMSVGGHADDENARPGARFFERFMEIKRKIDAEDPDEPSTQTCEEEDRLYASIKKTTFESREWLAYWSCWPIFFFAYWVIGLDLVDNNDKPKAYGLIVAMVLWVEVWGLKVVTAILPYFFAFLILIMDYSAAFFSVFFMGAVSVATKQAADVKDQVLKDQALEAVGGQSAKDQKFESNKWFYLAGVVFIALAIVSFFFQAVAASTGVVTVLIQWGMGIEAARRVKKTAKSASTGKFGESFEMIPHRLAFWIIQTVWVLFVSGMQLLALDDFLSSFTPFIFVAVIYLGEDSVACFLKMMTCVHAVGGHAVAGAGRLTLAKRPSGLEEPLAPTAL